MEISKSALEAMAENRAEIKNMNPCKKCGDYSSRHLVCYRGEYRVGCGQCDQEHSGFTYTQEAVNFWNLENPVG